MSEWQPINTYDEEEYGLNVLLWSEEYQDWFIPSCTLNREGEFLNKEGIALFATHWMNLPKPPDEL